MKEQGEGMMKAAGRQGKAGVDDARNELRYIRRGTFLKHEERGE